MKKTSVTTLCIIIQIVLFAQEAEPWISLPKKQWPKIALINTVAYKNGDSYLDPSFPYAGTGFVLTHGKDTFAATAKHVLWVARNKKSNTVAINDALGSWVMKVKGNNKDSVVIGKLLNEDSTEVLEGAQSTIIERDALFFSVQSISPAIYPLKPRFTPVKAGEKVFFISSDYMDSLSTVFEGTVLRKQGMDILIERDLSTFRGGASGSPIIDANGYLVAITSTSASDGETGKGVAVGISMEYFRDFLADKSLLNQSKKDYGKLIYETVKKYGVEKGIDRYYSLKNDPKNYYVYNLRTINRNGLLETGEKLMEEKRYKDAIEILKLNVKENSAFFRNYNALAEGYLLVGDKAAAIRSYKLSIAKYDDKEENEAFQELKKLGVELSPGEK